MKFIKINSNHKLESNSDAIMCVAQLLNIRNIGENKVKSESCRDRQNFLCINETEWFFVWKELVSKDADIIEIGDYIESNKLG